MSMCTRTLWFYIQKNSIAQLSTTCSSEEEKNCLLNSGKYLRYLLLEVKKKLRWGNTSLILYKDVSFHTQEHNPGFKKMHAASSKKQLEGWRDGSALRSTYSSCKSAQESLPVPMSEASQLPEVFRRPDLQGHLHLSAQTLKEVHII